ncbi:MAG: Cof-type HAD-IIB family hydrolase [Streptococcaceae bacterium]|jgi:Cof subfamily protein (haloacid dehalogenase superfamily)|nr:Cof-type HAD-IIB family hydrolase [Streptococcaceae bacterium]
MIQLIASDMDGTLLNEQMSISKANIEMIHHVQEQGIEFLVATGRSFEEAAPTLNEAGITCSLITSNGAQVFDKTGENVLSIAINEKKTQLVIDVLRKYGIYFELITQRGGFSEDKAQRLELLSQWLKSTSPQLTHEEALKTATDHLYSLPTTYIRRFDTLIKAQKHQVLKVFAMGSIHQDSLEYAKEDLGKITGVVVTSSGANNIEVNHIHAQKGLTLQKVADKLAIPMQNVVALGDNFNDISMLKAAGIGVAMGNAESQVKTIADYQALSNTQDGVAWAIREILAVKNNLDKTL